MPRIRFLNKKKEGGENKQKPYSHPSRARRSHLPLFVDEKQELEILENSAFNSSIYGEQSLEYYMPGILDTEEIYDIRRRKELRKEIKPKFYMIHDSFLAFFKDSSDVAKSIKKNGNSAWWGIIKSLVMDYEYLKLNELTRGERVLAAMAGASTLVSIFKKLMDINIEKLMPPLQMQEGEEQQQGGAQGAGGSASGGTADGSGGVGGLPSILEKASFTDFLTALAGVYQAVRPQAQGQGAGISEDVLKDGLLALKTIIKNSVKQTERLVKDYIDLIEDVRAGIAFLGGKGGFGAGKGALSVFTYLERPDIVRRTARIVKVARKVYTMLKQALPESLSKQQQVSRFGSKSGIARMMSEAQIKDLLPEELALLGLKGGADARLLKELTALKIMQKQASVYERKAAVKPIVFIDKSGSMYESFSNNIPKISVASGLGLAIYKKLNGEVYLFDTEVEKVDSRKIVDTLLRVEAGGGTDIAKVLRKIEKIGRRDYIYLIVTDAIDTVPNDVIQRLKEKGLAKKIKLILIPPAYSSGWVEEFEHYNVKDLDSFVTASRKALSP